MSCELHESLAPGALLPQKATPAAQRTSVHWFLVHARGEASKTNRGARNLEIKRSAERFWLKNGRWKFQTQVPAILLFGYGSKLLGTNLGKDHHVQRLSRIIGGTGF